MSRRKSSARRGGNAKFRRLRTVIESLETRLLLSGSNEAALLGAIDSALQANNSSGLGAWTQDLDDASSLGKNLPLIGTTLSNLSLNAGLALNSTESSLSALVTDIQKAGNNALVSASRDLPNDVEIDFTKTVSKSISGPLNASFGLPLTLPGTVNATVSFNMSLTVGAYWDSDTSSAVFYVVQPTAQLNATVTATATLNSTGASLGFVTLGITSPTASINGQFSMTLNAQPPVDSSEQAGRLTLGQLTSTPISSLVNTSLSSPSPTTLSFGISTPLASGAHNITLSWPDITNPTDVTSSLSTDPTLAALSNLENVNGDSFSSGVDMLTGELESLASTSISNLSIFQKKLPLVNESIASAVNFQQFFKSNFSNITDEVPNPSGILSSPFQNSDQLLSLLKTIPNSTVSDLASGNQIIYTLAFNKNISTSLPLSLNLGSELNLNVTSTLNFNVNVAVNVQFGVDGSTGNFFVVVSNQPAVSLTANLSATVTGSASLGFISVNINNGTLSGTGTGTIALVDPQTDSPATPGIITANELASSNLSSLFNVAFTGSASASLPLSTTVPGINPVTLSMSWPDLTNPSSVTFNSSDLTQLLGFNGLSFQTVLGYLENLPTMLQNLAGPKALGGSLAFLGSSVGKAVTLGNDLNTDVITPLQTANINTVQDLETFLASKLTSISSASTLGLNVSSSDIDFSFDFKPSYSTSANWSLSNTFDGGLLSFQTSGAVPLMASLDAKLEVGISLSDLTNPTDDFYVVEGPSSQITGSFSASINNIVATATVGYLATVGISNGTASVNGSLSLPLGSGSAGTPLTLTDLLANPTDLFGSPSFTGSVNVHLPLSGLPGQTGTPYLGLNWSNITDLSTVAVDTSTINLNALNPLANFDASSVLGSIGSVLSLIQQWGGSTIMKTDIPLINEPVSSVIDFASEAEQVFQQIQSISATTPSAFDAAVEAAPQAAGFLSSDVNLVAGSLDNPGSQTFDYVLEFHKTVSTNIPFDFGPGFFTIAGNIGVSVTFNTDLEFGYDAADGLYIVGNSNPADPAVSLSVGINAPLDRLGGTFGPVSYGISNGLASANLALQLNLDPPGDNGSKISASDMLSNAASIIVPSITGMANLNMPIGFTIGSDGPGVTTTFSASWNPSRSQPFEYGPNNSTDITDGFGPVNYDLGEFVNKIVGPVLSDIESDNPIPQSVIDTLNETIPVIDMTPGQILGDYLDNPGFKLLLGIDTALSDMPSSGADFVDLTNYFQSGQMPTGGDSGGPMGGVPPSGNPNGTPTSGNFGAFASFQQTLENDFYLKLPILDSPATSIINILTHKAVTLVEFDPGEVSLSVSYETPQISFPLVDFGFGDVSATLQAGVSASLFADIDIELTTTGLDGTYISGGKLAMGQSPNLLDGLAINDSDEYQAGIDLSGNVTIGGSVDILGYSAASLSGSLTLSGIMGVHINDLSYNKDGTIQGPANYQGNGPGDNEVHLDELEYLVNNYGLECAVMPEGEIDATLSLSVSALDGLFTKQLASGTVTLANFNGPCASTLADLASIQGTSLVMNPNSSTAGLDVTASIVENTTTGQPQYLRLTTVNSSTNDYQLFALSDLSAANVNTLVLQGTNGNDEFFVDPAVTQAGEMHNLQFVTGNGNDRVNLASLTATNSTITGETINAGNGNDTITGNYAPEVITLGSGVNQVSMGSGNDSVTASSGTDTILGSNGNDTVIAGSGSDLIGLGDGNNQITAGAGQTTISVGNGKNLISSGSGTETITAGDGDNKIFADTGGGNITVGAGQDIIYATSGNSKIAAGGGNDFIVVGAGTNTVNGGTGNTLLAVVANANQTLISGQVTVAGLGMTTFSNIATVSLTGGVGNNSFNISGWTGLPVQINGGGGTDTIVSNDNTSFTLTDSSLQRTDGTTFGLTGISNALLTSGATDATFDLSNWHGAATLTGGSGTNTLAASNLTTATLTNTTLARTGLPTISFTGITQANLTGSIFGGAHIDASAFSGTVALFGQGASNTLIGGSGSDYILGGGSANVLVGNGLQDNQLVGGTGPGDNITGGAGNNILVGSTSGSDVITTGSGSSHIYTPGGNDTINAQTGNAIIYLTGSGNTVNSGSATTNVALHPGDAGTTSTDFIASNLYLGEFPQAPGASAATLPSGPAETGQWVELAGSASNGGVSDSPGTAIDPSIVATGSGASSAEIIAWADNRSGVYEIYVAKYSNGAWQELAGSAHGGGISNSTIPSLLPSITLDSSGNPIVAWTEGGNIVAAHYNGSAWVSLGQVSSSGQANSAQVINTTAAPVIAWLDSSGGHTNVYVRQFNGTSWIALGTGSDSGNGISASTSNIASFAIATDGTHVAVAWTQSGTSAGSSIYLSQYSGSTWAAVNGSTSSTGISGANSSSMPTVAYEGGSIYAAWTAVLGGTTNIVAAVGGSAPWTNVAIDTPTSAGTNQISRGAASNPVLSANGSALDLVWIENRLTTAPDQAAAIYATRFVGGKFSRQLPGDAAFDGILHRSTALSSPIGLALAVDGSGHPFVAWGDNSLGSSQVDVLGDNLDVSKVIYVNDGLSVTDSYTTAAGSASNNGLTPNTPLNSIQAALNLTLTAGTVILVDSGTQAGFTATSADNGVLIFGSPGAPTIVSSAATLTKVSNMTLLGLQLAGGLTINGGSGDEVLYDSGASAAQVALGHGGAAALQSTSSMLILHSSFAGLTVSGTTSGLTVENNTIEGTGIAISGGSTGLLIADNQLVSLALNATSAGTITANNIAGSAGTGLMIAAAFTGSIDHNLIHNSTVGVTMSASAPLNANSIFSNKTGVIDSLANSTTGLGFLAGALPNQIVDNGVGVNLTGLMQGQEIGGNVIGITGSGVLGGSSLTSANFIWDNAVGADFVGTVQYDLIERNEQSLIVQNGQLIDHDVFDDNAGNNLETDGADNVEIIDDSFFALDSTNIMVDGGSSDVEILNNVLWAEADYDLYIADDSRVGFFSDYDDLYTSGSGQIVHYLADFHDILDWQQALNQFDLHSIGATVLSAGEGRPAFVDVSLGDLRVFPAAGGLRYTSPTVSTGDPATDLALPTSYQNLLTNPSFEAGVSGWTVNVGGTTQSSNPAAFDGSNYFFAGSVASGFAQQTISLTAAGYSTTQLDAQDLNISVGGRIRSAGETVVDQGELIVTFLDGSGSTIGSPTTLFASNSSTRWELVSGSLHIPVGARSVTYRFQNLRETGSTDDSYLDHAFLYVVSNTVASDMGAFGNTAASVATPADQSIAIQSPDLYVNWSLNQPHTILWNTIGNTGGSPVRIDLYQDIAGVPTFNQTLAASLSDTGSFSWIPANFGLSAGTSGWRIQVSLVNNTGILDRSTETFAIPTIGTSFYINDGSMTGDQYATAVGNNRNTGTSPSSPLPMLTTLMRTYTLNSSDTILIDNGSYNTFAAAVFSSNPALGTGPGATVHGPTDNGTLATITALGYTNDGIIDVNNANFVTITNLSFSGGEYGIWGLNGSLNLTLSSISATGTTGGGIRIESNSTGAALDHITANFNGGDGVYVGGGGTTLSTITADNNGGDGIFVGGAITSLANSTADNNADDGFDLVNTGSATVTNNEASGNQTGLYVSNSGSGQTVVGNSNLSAGQGNIIHNNSVIGISVAFGSEAIYGNTVYGQTSGNGNSSGIGIVLDGNNPCSDNVIWGNVTGVSGLEAGTLSDNRIYDNSLYGILEEAVASIVDNDIYSNGIGIQVNNSTTETLQNNLIYANVTAGIVLNGGVGISVLDNTIYQTTGDAVRAIQQTSSLSLRDNILWDAASGGFDINIDSSSESGFSSDYNLLFTSGSAQLGDWGGIAQITLNAFRAVSGTNANSLVVAPLFVSMAGVDGLLGFSGGVDHGLDDDFHDQSTAGSFHGGALAPDASTGLPALPTATLTADGGESPAIDRGDPAAAFNLEPTPNGGFINIGAFGNTAQASESPIPFVILLTPNGGESALAGQSYTIKWRSEDTSSSVLIELLEGSSLQAAESNAAVATIASAAPDSGSFLWAIPSGINPASDYYIRLTRAGMPTAVAVSAAAFTIKSPVTTFYINDGTVAGGDYTTAPGSDANDGLSPSTPMATIAALLQTYTLGANDTILVDNGMYNIAGNIVLTAANSGLTIKGFTGSGGSSIINRNNTAGGSYVFDIQGATGVTLEDMSITGASIGINVSNGAGSTGLKIENNQIENNFFIGISIGTGNNGATISGNTVFGQSDQSSSNGGIVVNSDSVNITDNIVHDNFWVDINVEGSASGSVSGNTAYDSNYGIEANNISVSGNIAYSNSTDGILATGTATVTGNTAHDNTLTPFGNHAGIELQTGASASGNIAYNNRYGILLTGNGISANNNLAYDNSTAGISVNGGPDTVSGSVMYGNGWGIQLPAASATTITNNLIYNNSSGGIDIQFGQLSPTMINNTIYQPAGDGIRIESYATNSGGTTIPIRDNIIWVQNGFDLNIASTASTYLASDYNDLYATGSGQVGSWQGAAETTFAAWQSTSFNDADSISADPIFVNVSTFDFHVQSTNGSFHGGSLAPILSTTTGLPQTVPTPPTVNDAANSPAIDRGAPGDAYNLEPAPNGSFVNLGTYGDTNQASLSPSSSYVLVIHPNGGDNWATKQTFTILWHDDQIGLAGTQTVKIDLVQGGTTTNIATGLTDVGHYAWTIPASIASGSNYQIRVTETGSSASSDISDNTFSIVQAVGIYYVNDGSVSPGDITTVPGNDANNGLTPATPKADIQSILSSYTLNPGDVINVDVGTYNLSSNILLTAAQNGIIIKGPGIIGGTSRYTSIVQADSPTAYYQMNETSGTVATDSSGHGNNATYVGAPSLGQAVALGAPSPSAVGFNGNSQYVQLPNGFANIAGGFTFEAWINPTSTNNQENFFDLGNGTNNEIYLIKDVFTNNLQLGGSYGSVIINSAISYGTWQDIAVTISGGAVTIYKNGVAIGSGSITAPDNTTRTTNKLGAGASFQPFQGQMEEAAFYSTALSATQIANHYSGAGAAVLNRGNTASNAEDFQLDGGSNITIENLTLTGGGEALEVTSGTDSTNDTVTNCVLYANSGNAIDMFGFSPTADNFTLSNSVIAYNGGDGYNGVNNNTPVITGNIFLANGQSGINVSSIGGTFTNNQLIANGANGINSTSDNTNVAFTISGNTITGNGGAGVGNNGTNVIISGNTISGQTNVGQYGIAGNGLVENNILFGNYIGIDANGAVAIGNRVYNNNNEGIFYASGASIIGNFIYSNATYGIEGGNNASAVTNISNNLIYANALGGFDSSAPAFVQLINNTIYQLTGIGLTASNNAPLTAASAVIFRNNIVEVAAGPAYSIDAFTLAGFLADYNDIDVTGTGSIASIAGQTFTAPTSWIYETGGDSHSIWTDPQFVNPSGADGILGYSGGVDHGGDDNFHVRSTSPTIDAGSPTTDLINEPVPNGGRINLGYDGNTSAAAVSPSTTLQVLSPTSLAKLQAGTPSTIQWMSTGLLASQVLTEVNVGGTATGEWNASEYNVGTQNTFSVTSAINTSGVTNPAPQSVYQTCAFATSGIGNSISYQIPVPDGTYTLRLDFSEPNQNGVGLRVFNVLLQGQTVQSQYDIYAAAGNALNKATALSFNVTASGGSGISLKLLNDTFAGALLCGLEVMSATAGAPASQSVNVQVSTNNGSTWSTVATNQPLDSEGRGSFIWTPTAATNGATALVRVVANNTAATTSAAAGPFLIAPSGNSYYVNANSTGGSDANDGKTPATPMSSIQAVLNAYHPGAGATIFVDSGTYSLFENIVLTSANSGLTIEGTPSQNTVLNRGGTNSGDYVFDFQNASNVTLDHLSMTGAFAAINAAIFTTDSGETISNDLIFSNAVYGIFTNDQTGWLVTSNSIHDTGNSGGGGVVFLNCQNNVFTNNTFFNNPSYGIELQVDGGFASTISGSTVDANGTGIYASGSVTISGNTVFSNTTYGIDAESGALAVGNTISKQTAGTGSAAINLQLGSEARNNIIYDNYNGIVSSNGTTTIDRNKIYSNLNNGISLTSNAFAQVVDNLIYANAGAAISISNIINSGSVLIANNTVYEIAADAVKISSVPYAVTVRNNILWTQNGFDLDLDIASQVAFVSDYNDLMVSGSAKVGFWGGAAQATLANWQSASSQGAHSISADPKFVDIDGADNVLGYTTANNGANDGADDDFYLSAGSPAIDDAYSWVGYTTDIEGVPHTDDPGTPNTGSPDYLPAVQSSSLFTAGGTAQNWTLPSGNSWTYTLPFAFPFYGVNHTSITVTANGMIELDGTSAISTANSDANLLSHAIIAPLWDILATNFTGDNIFVTSSSTQVTIRWNATKVSNQAAVNFQVTLFSNGQIEFDYGSGNTGLMPTVGISSGDGQHYQIISGYDGHATLTNADSIIFNTVAGFVDMGAYEFHGNSSATTPPTLTATTPTTINSSATTPSISSIGLTFSAALNSIDALAASDYQLLGADGGGVFDITYALSPQYVAGSNQLTLNIVNGPLPVGTYRLTVLSTATGGVHDVNGLLLDGDNNGIAGGSYVRTFSVASAALNLNSPNAYVKLDADGQHVDVWSNTTATGSPTQYLLSGISSTTYTGPSGNNDFILDFSSGDPLPVSGFNFTGGSGQNTLEIIGTSGNDNIVVGAAQVMFNSIPVAFTNAQTLLIDPGAGADSLAVNAGTVTLPAGTGGFLTRHLASLSIANGAEVLVTTAGSSSARTVLVVDTLSISSTGKLDLTNNDMIVHNGSSILTQINSELALGFNNGLWNGNGIASGSASTTHNTALGMELNDDGTAGHGLLLTTFDGQTSLFNTDVLVKYTYYGDADLSGADNATDYILIDNGFNSHGAKTGWRNGDFNYDGVINGDDYTLIDNAYNTQGSVTFAAIPATLIANNMAQPATGTMSVMPHAEPASFSTTAGAEQTGAEAAPDSSELKKRHRTAWQTLEESGS